jgi:hypothetical protein
MAVAICSRDALVKVGIVSRRDSDAGNLGGRLERDDDDAKQEFHRRQNSFRSPNPRTTVSNICWFARIPTSSFGTSINDCFLIDQNGRQQQKNPPYKKFF